MRTERLHAARRAAEGGASAVDVDAGNVGGDNVRDGDAHPIYRPHM